MIHYTKSIRNVPEEVQREADVFVAQGKEAKRRRIQEKPRVNVAQQMTVGLVGSAWDLIIKYNTYPTITSHLQSTNSNKNYSLMNRFTISW